MLGVAVEVGSLVAVVADIAFVLVEPQQLAGIGAFVAAVKDQFSCLDGYS